MLGSVIRSRTPNAATEPQHSAPKDYLFFTCVSSFFDTSAENYSACNRLSSRTDILLAEDIETLGGNFPLAVHLIQLPVIVNGEGVALEQR